MKTTQKARIFLCWTAALLLIACGPPPGSICDDTNNPCGGALSCVHGICQQASCGDDLRNGGESGVDCGGPCPRKCGDGIACGSARDCASGICAGGLCVSTACSNGVRDGDETDVDCGGSCPARCGFGRACASGTNCISGLCTNGACAASCSDQIRDGDETAVDCGGSCARKCGPGAGCASAGDCALVANGTPGCNGDVCVFTCAAAFHPSGTSCVADTTNCCGASCSDCATAFSNGTGSCSSGSCVLTGCNTGFVPVDGACVSAQSNCCGAGCVDCTRLYANGVGSCSAGTCVFVSCNGGFHQSGGSCVADSCSDSIKNQTETGVDCGGVCVSQGKTCADGVACAAPTDCTSQYCSGNVCATCGQGSHLCSNSCVANSSVNSCGSGCSPCPVPANGSATCDGTSCGIACAAGYHPDGGACTADTNVCCGSSCVDCTGGGEHPRGRCSAGKCGGDCYWTGCLSGQTCCLDTGLCRSAGQCPL